VSPYSSGVLFRSPGLRSRRKQSREAYGLLRLPVRNLPLSGFEISVPGIGQIFALPARNLLIR
jgi:hypothetical protein